MVVMALYNKWKGWAKYWKLEIIVLILLFRRPDLSKYAKMMVFFLLSYIFSPIDLIPDFIPIFGHWDDFLLIPITLWLITKITPPALIEDVRRDLKDNPNQVIFKGKGPKIAAISFVVIWVAITFLILHLVDFEKYIGLT